MLVWAGFRHVLCAADIPTLIRGRGEISIIPTFFTMIVGGTEGEKERTMKLLCWNVKLCSNIFCYFFRGGGGGDGSDKEEEW